MNKVPMQDGFPCCRQLPLLAMVKLPPLLLCCVLLRLVRGG